MRPVEHFAQERGSQSPIALAVRCGVRRQMAVRRPLTKTTDVANPMESRSPGRIATY